MGPARAAAEAVNRISLAVAGRRVETHCGLRHVGVEAERRQISAHLGEQQAIVHQYVVAALGLQLAGQLGIELVAQEVERRSLPVKAPNGVVPTSGRSETMM